MALTSSTVDSLFARLFVHYGDDWLRKWDGVPNAALRASWLRELGGLSNAKIEHALAHLPERPPTVSQFRNLCANAPAQYLALPLPKPTEEEKARARTILAETKRRIALSKVAK